MQTTDQVAGEAREKLAERLAFGLRANCTHYALRIEECELVIAALRAQPERGAEEMRERAVEVCETIAREAGKIGPLASVGAAMCTAALRTLPVQPTKDKGVGR